MDPVSLERFGLTLSQVGAVVQGRSTDAPLCSLETGAGDFLLRVDADVERAEDLRDLFVVRRPDGSGVCAFYGNNTLNPVGVWEPRPVPNSNRVMATAAAHHAMTAGSIILLDVKQGIDGLKPITRLTPDALFPESEFPVRV